MVYIETRLHFFVFLFLVLMPFFFFFHFELFIGVGVIIQNICLRIFFLLYPSVDIGFWGNEDFVEGRC